MGIFDRIRGKREQQPAEVDATSSAAASAVSPSLDLDVSQRETLRDPSRTVNTEVTPGVSFRHEEQTRLYNPYEGLGAALDKTRAPGAFKLPTQPEFLFSEEALVRKRSWSENLTYYTGVGYLGGALIGGGRGAYQSLTAPVAIAGVDSSRLRVNQLLNTSGKLGRGAGNALGVLGLFFASFESLLGYANDGLLPDELVTVVAGGGTGSLFRSVRGPRQAAVAGVLGLAGGSVLVAARRYINRGL